MERHKWVGQAQGVRKYMAEAVITRQFQEQHPQQGKQKVSGWCPVCALARNQKIAQTKEHLYGGECRLTKQIAYKYSNKIRHMLEEKLRNSEEADELIKIWTKEEAKVRFESRCIEQHKHAPTIIGIWDNITTLKIRNRLMEKQNWTKKRRAPPRLTV